MTEVPSVKLRAVIPGGQAQMQVRQHERNPLAYELPQITDYGDLREMTASLIFRTIPDAEAPGEHGDIDDNTGPCAPDAPPEHCS